SLLPAAIVPLLPTASTAVSPSVFLPVIHGQLRLGGPFCLLMAMAIVQMKWYGPMVRTPLAVRIVGAAVEVLAKSILVQAGRMPTESITPTRMVIARLPRSPQSLMICLSTSMGSGE